MGLNTSLSFLVIMKQKIVSNNDKIVWVKVPMLESVKCILKSSAVLEGISFQEYLYNIIYDYC